MAALPKELQTGAFLKSRIKELSGLSYVISSDLKHGKLASQQVPRHMRRRAVSHDVRRLPRRLREKYLKEKNQGGGNVPAAKRPCRKHRRRASNLLQEYNRRQMQNFWMETHIWHAKRFHIENKWGYKIPTFPNDKCWRACYRAAKSSSLMFDLSYLNPLQIKGRVSVLTDRLGRLTRAETGKTFGSPSIGKERTALLFGRSGHVIGEVSFLWIPVEEKVDASCSPDSFVTLWIFCHPALVADALAELKAVFDVADPVEDQDATECMDITVDQDIGDRQTDNIPKTEVPAVSEDKGSSNENAVMEMTADPCVGESSEPHKTPQLSDIESSEPVKKKIKLDKPEEKNVNQEKLRTRNVPLTRAPRFLGAEGVDIVDLQGTINRFHLTGPKAMEVLKCVCVPADVGGTEPSATPSPATPVTPSLSTSSSDLHWWKQVYADQKQRSSLAEQTRPFQAASVPKDLAGNLALTVRDPRLLLPIKKYAKTETYDDAKTDKDTTKKSSNTSNGSSEQLEAPTTGWTRSPFFNSSVRDAVTLSKCSDAEINDKRSKLIVPGSSLNLGEDESRVPVVLLPQGTGVDLLVPAGWGMSFWLCLVFNGCRVGGLREYNHLHLEQGLFPPLCSYPDSAAGAAQAAETADSLQTRHFQLPPNKRVNFSKLGIAAPFRPLWTTLLRDWRAEGGFKTSDEPEPELRILRDEAFLEQLRQGQLPAIAAADQLVAVRLQVAGKGCLGENTLICIPSQQDLEMGCGWEGPVERIQEDTMEKERKETREEHQARKKRLKRQWKKLKDKQVLLKAQSVALGKPLDEEKLALLSSNLDTVKKIRNTENAEFGAKTEHLWLGDCTTVRNSCKREIFGYTVTANMAYTHGAYVGFGFVTLRGLEEWRSRENNPRGLVLTRETSSTQYRFSVLTIL